VLATLSESLIRSFANSLIEIHPSHFQSVDDFADNALDGEVGTIDQVRVRRDDQRGSLPGRIRPVAGRYLIPVALRDPPAQTDFR
jgi:hypothetical protein